MIFNSEYWKEELFHNARWLCDSINKKRWNSRSWGKLEKTIMISFYSIRKLSEAKKIPKEYLEKKIEVTKYPKNDCIKMISDSSNFINNYDLKKGEDENIQIGYLLNQIIHSFSFIPVLNRDQKGLRGLLFNSDRSKNECLYHIEIRKIIDIIVYISNGSISSAKYIFENGELVLKKLEYMSPLELKDIK